MKKHLCLGATALFLLIFCLNASEAALFKKESSVMGTALEVVLLAPTEADAKAAFLMVEAEMVRIEKEMSEWDEGSALSAVNSAAGKRAVEVPKELFNVISAALQVSSISGGAFDITWASMKGLWDFRPGHERAPEAQEVRARLGLVDYREVVLDPAAHTVFLRKKGMAIGLGGIAKGYAVDKAMEKLLKSGITSAVIKAGGDIRVQGHAENGLAWEVGIQDPRDRARLMAKLTLSNVSISTSGDYERFFIKDGRLYHHIMDPKTGFPATGVRSVTVIAPDTMTSDALSTAIFVLGPQKGLELAGRLPGVEAVIVDDDGAVMSTGGVDPRR